MMNRVGAVHFYLLTPQDVRVVYLEDATFLYCKRPDGSACVLGKFITSYKLKSRDWDITASKERAERHLERTKG